MPSKYRLDIHRMKRKEVTLVHEASCRQFHSLVSFIELGEFMFCSTALQRARTLGFAKVDGCKECCAPCHVGE